MENIEALNRKKLKQLDGAFPCFPSVCHSVNQSVDEILDYYFFFSSRKSVEVRRASQQQFGGQGRQAEVKGRHLKRGEQPTVPFLFALPLCSSAALEHTVWLLRTVNSVAASCTEVHEGLIFVAAMLDF